MNMVPVMIISQSYNRVELSIAIELYTVVLLTYNHNRNHAHFLSRTFYRKIRNDCRS